MQQTELIERYVAAVLDSVPPDGRAQADRELRARIAGALEAHGSDEEKAVRQVLAGFGDPAELAVGYGGSRRSLIGPALYPSYIKLLGTLLLIIVPIVFAAVLAVNLWSPEGRGGYSLLDALEAAFQTGIMIAFWVTLVFAVLERAGVTRQLSRKDGSAWSLDALPAPAPKRQITLAESVSSLIFLVLLIGLVLWQQSHSVIHSDGEPVPLLDQALWSFWIPAFIVLIAAMIGIEVWKFAVARWTLSLVIANLVANLIFAVFVVVLLRTQQVIDPRFSQAMEEMTGTDLPGNVTAMVITVLVIGISVWDSIDCVIKYLRGRRSASAAVAETKS